MAMMYQDGQYHTNKRVVKPITQGQIRSISKVVIGAYLWKGVYYLCDSSSNRAFLFFTRSWLVR